MNTQNVPFSVPDVRGLRVDIGGRSRSLWGVEVSGLACADAVGLHLQFHITDRAASYDEIRKIDLPLATIDLVDVKRRWLKPFVWTVQVKDLDLVKHAPGARGGTLTLDVQRRDRLILDEVVSSLALYAAELR